MFNFFLIVTVVPYIIMLYVLSTTNVAFRDSMKFCVVIMQ